MKCSMYFYQSRYRAGKDTKSLTILSQQTTENVFELMLSRTAKPLLEYLNNVTIKGKIDEH